jgi:hypothetical protein
VHVSVSSHIYNVLIQCKGKSFTLHLHIQMFYIYTCHVVVYIYFFYMQKSEIRFYQVNKVWYSEMYNMA